MYIYILWNELNGKCYIGQTVNEPNERLKQHRYLAQSAGSKKSSMIALAIRKHGWENFSKYVLQVCHTQQELDHAEEYWIDKMKTMCPLGYNMVAGGAGRGRTSELTRARQREAAKNRPPVSELTKRKTSESMKNVQFDPAWCESIRQSKVGAKNPLAKLDWETVRAIRETYSSGVVTQEQLAQIYKVQRRAIGRILNNQRWVDPSYPGIENAANI